MIFIRYDDKNEGKRGYVFFYPSQDKTYLIESADTHSVQVSDLDDFETTIC